MAFTCQPGFILRGIRNITCNDGTWNGSVPVCRGKRGMSDPSLQLFFFALADDEEPKRMEPEHFTFTSSFCCRLFTELFYLEKISITLVQFAELLHVN